MPARPDPTFLDDLAFLARLDPQAAAETIAELYRRLMAIRDFPEAAPAQLLRNEAIYGLDAATDRLSAAARRRAVQSYEGNLHGHA